MITSEDRLMSNKHFIILRACAFSVSNKFLGKVQYNLIDFFLPTRLVNIWGQRRISRDVVNIMLASSIVVSESKLQSLSNQYLWQHPTRHQLYGHLPSITKTIPVRRTRNAGHCWRSKDELISDVLLWTPKYGQAKAGRPARTYIQQLCEDTGCIPEDLPEAMNDREKWRERVRDIRGSGTTWWWWWWCVK